MGGTRFIGKSLVKQLLSKKFNLTLFTRGKQPVPKSVEHVQGDRKNTKDLRALSGKSFDVIIDTSGRTLKDTKDLIEITGYPKFRFLYISSSGIYQKSEVLPLTENAEIDNESRHIGKAHTENWLAKESIPFTVFRPTYIYGPGNYNPIERWFFDRIVNNKAIPIPGEGNTLTQLGHVNDLADAMVLSLESSKAKDKIYNCSGKKAVTLKGLIFMAAVACRRDPLEVRLAPFDLSKVDPKGRKAFPLRLEHFFTDISNLQNDLNWEPKFDLQKGLEDSFKNDYLLEPTLNPDFSSDLNLIGNSNI